MINKNSDEKKAHISEDGFRKQSVKEHNELSAQLAEAYGAKMKVSSICKISALLHDLGKVSNEFQEYLEKRNQGVKVTRGSVNHASAGAYYVMNHFVDRNSAIDKLTKALIAEVIVSHHGLKDFVSIKGDNVFVKTCMTDPDGYDEVMNYIDQQLNVCEIDRLYDKAVQETGNLVSKIKMINDMKPRYGDTEKDNEKQNEIEKMFDASVLVRLLLSILINADREDTRAFMLDVSTPQLKDTKQVWKNAIDKLEDKLSTFPQGDILSRSRSEISEACKIAAKEKPGIYRLSCPTGSGKTLASMRYALYHAYKFEKKHIFYIAPYKSILSQNSRIIKQLFDKDEVLEHHSNIVPDNKQAYAYLNSNWSTPVVTTTAVQFYQMLFSNNTTSIRRFHQLCDSVIIIDEAQTMPLKMMNMFNLMINFLADICHSTIVICTATQPLFEKAERPMNIKPENVIVNHRLELFEAFKRVHMVNACTKAGFNLEEYAAFIMQCWRKHKTVLVIVNTKKEAFNLFKLCKELKKQEDETINTVHLSTHMCAEHRDDELKNIKKDLISNLPVICISTSLIEAGVDISFDCVIRSVTGLDSIIQAAGRCNRNKTSDFGYVYIVKSNSEAIDKLKSVSEGKKVMLSYLQKIKKESETNNYVDELMYPEFIKSYYEEYLESSDINMDYVIDNETMITLWSGKHKGEKEIRYKIDRPALTSALKTAGESFEVISPTIGVLVPYGYGAEIIKGLKSNMKLEMKYELIQKAQPFMVQVYEGKYRELVNAGIIEVLDFAEVMILKGGYDKEVGLCLDQEMSDLFY